MSKARVLLADGLAQNGQSILRAYATVDDKSGIDLRELLKIVPSYEGIVVRERTRIKVEVLEAAPKLRVIGCAGASVDNVDLDAARARGVTVVNAPAAGGAAEVELVFALILALAREVPRADSAMKKGEWPRGELKGVELVAKTLGIIGFGEMGVELGRRAAAFGMNVVAYDPFAQEATLRQGGAESASLQDLYSWSDFIVLNLPLDVQTRDFLGPVAISQMRDGVRIICVGGGGLVDEAALLDGLKSGKVAGAAMDVFQTEPPGPTSLISHPHVIATPRIAVQTTEAQLRAAEDVSNELVAALQGRPLRWKVA